MIFRFNKSSAPPQLLWLVLLVAFGLRIAYLIIYSGLPEWDQLTVDANFHHHWAQRIADGNILGDTTFFRAPLYIYLLALLYLVFGSSLWVGHILGLLLGLASVAMTYRLGHRLFGQSVGLIASAIHALYPIAMYFEQELLVEPLFLLLLVIALERLVAWYHDGLPRDAFLTALFTGLAAITRPTGLLLIPIILIVLIVRRKELSGIAKHTALVIVALLATIGPITTRNIVVADDPTLIASSGGINLFIGNNPEADGVSAVLPPPLGPNWRLDQVKYHAEQYYGADLTWGEVSVYWRNRAIIWATENPGDFLSLYAKKLYLHFSNQLISNNRELDRFLGSIQFFRYNIFSFILVFGFAVIGLAAGGWRGRGTWPLLAFGGIYLLVSALFFYATRFRYPLLPLFFIFAAYGGVRIVSLRQENPTRALAVGLIGVAAAILSLLNFAPLPERTSTHALSERGLYHFSQGNYDRALQYQRAALRADPDYPGSHNSLGATFLRMQRLDSAVVHFQAELDRHPWFTGALTNLAYAHLIAGNLDRAQQFARDAIDREPYRYNPNSILLRTLYSDSTVPGATLIAESRATANRTNNDIYLLNDAAELLIGRQIGDASRDLLLRALEAKPPPIETDHEAFRHTFRHSHEHMNAQRARAAVQLSFLYGLDNKFADALLYARKAVRWDPSLIQAWLNVHNAYRSLGRNQAADSVLSEAAERFPNDPTIRQYRHR